MSDLHVWELGPHDCTKPHEWPFGQETWCPGGREIVLRRVNAFDLVFGPKQTPESIDSLAVYVLVEEA